MISVRIGLYISMLLACCSYVRAYVLSDVGTKGASQYSKDIESRIIFLEKFLHEINSAKRTVQSPKDVASLTDAAELPIGVASNTDTENPKVDVASHTDAAKSSLGVVSYSDAVVSPVATSHTDTEQSYIEESFKDIEEMIRILELEDTPNKQDIVMEKKDYSILPPASEWCRLMGIRRCRGSNS